MIRTTHITTDPTVDLLIIVAMLGISRAIKFVMLSRMGETPHLGFSTFSYRGFLLHQPSWRYMDVYAPDTYLTRVELTRITLIPHLVSLVILGALLPLVPPVLQFAAIFGFAMKAPDILIPLINLGVAHRCPPGTLFVESDGGVLDVYRAAGPGSA